MNDYEVSRRIREFREQFDDHDDFAEEFNAAKESAEAAVWSAFRITVGLIALAMVLGTGFLGWLVYFLITTFAH